MKKFLSKLWWYTKREYVYILFFCLVSIFFIFSAPFILRAVINAGNNYYHTKALHIEELLTQKTEETYSIAKSIAEYPPLVTAIKNKNVVDVLSLLNEIKDQYHIPSLGVTDNEGIILSRTTNSTNRGDNVFLTSTQGQYIVQNKKVATIEKANIWPVSIVAAYPVKENNTFVGAVFAGGGLDDTFATAFKQETGASEVIFYSNEKGVVGSSATNEKMSKTFEKIFTPGSDWIKDGVGNTIVRFPDGTTYHLQNIVFPGLTKSPGGMIVLFKFNVARPVVGAELLSLIILFVIFLSGKRLFSKKFKEHRHNPVHHLIAVSFVTIVVVYITMSFSLHKEIITIKIPSFAIYNSTLSLNPSTGIFTTSENQHITVKIASGGEAVNAFDIKIHFDPSVVSIDSIDTSKSICPTELFLEKTIDNEKGILEISCILLHPGFAGKNAIIANIVTKAKKEGRFSLEIDPTSQVLADDGLGTNVLRYSENGSFTAISNTGSSTLLVYSLTHPNSEVWYNNARVNFVWKNCENCTYKYLVNEDENSYDPSALQLVNTYNLTSDIHTDGIRYIHLQQTTKDNATSSLTFKVKIDTVPPVSPQISIDRENPPVNTVVRLHLESSDEMSGLQYNYYVKFDNGIFLPTRADLYSSFDTPGPHTITVRVYDMAGNYSESNKTIKVQ